MSLAKCLRVYVQILEWVGEGIRWWCRGRRWVPGGAPKSWFTNYNRKILYICNSIEYNYQNCSTWRAGRHLLFNWNVFLWLGPLQVDNNTWNLKLNISSAQTGFGHSLYHQNVSVLLFKDLCIEGHQKRIVYWCQDTCFCHAHYQWSEL